MTTASRASYPARSGEFDREVGEDTRLASAPKLRRQLSWLIAIRLVVITSVMVPNVLLQLRESALNESKIHYSSLYLVAGATYLLSLLYLALQRWLRDAPQAQAYVQFLGDLGIVTGLVHHFGGIDSPFSMLYLLVISVAASLLRRRAAIFVATVAYAAYATLTLGLFFDWLQPGELGGSVAASGWRVAYNLAVHLFGFYAVAFLTSYLAQNVSQAESALRENREDLAALRVVHRDVVQSIASGLITTDGNGIVTFVNRAGEEILGWPAAQLVGQSIAATHLIAADGWATRVAECEQGGRARSYSDFDTGGSATGGGRHVHVGYGLNRLADASGTPRGYIVVFQDLTEVRQLQEEIRIKDRMAAVGELAAGLAHEIGNPLAAISGSVQMLATNAVSDPAQRKLLDIVLKESQRLDRTIKGFLRFARPRDRSSARFDIATLLQENTELLRNSEETGPNHHVELALAEPSAFLLADPDQISQIFWNLARNALRAMPGGGHLRILGAVQADSYRFEVRDDGRGMREEERARLFQPFRSGFGGGTGIGMAIVYRIVEEHGGRITVESHPHRGTSIAIELPGASRPAEARSGAQLEAAS
jgi:two-component system, NtrC family, sensor histidine kinase PilS